MKQVRPGHEQLGDLCRTLGQMYHAGIGAGDAFALMAEDTPSAGEKALLQSMSQMADEGLPLAGIFRAAGCFPEYACALMQVGEQVGRSEDMLKALADYYDGRVRLERLLKSTLLYPAVLLLVLLAVAVILLVWILPVFNDVYARLGSSLIGLAGGLLAFGTLLRKLLPLLAALLILSGCLAAAAAASAAFRKKLAGIWQRSRGDRGICRRIHTARFLQALAMGMSGGLTDRESVELASRLAGENAAFQRRCAACLEKLDGGSGLAPALREAGLLSGAQCRLLETGIRTGSGAQAMEQLSLKALEESEYELEALVGRIEPTLVLILSALVGSILLSVMLPLMHIMTTIG